MLLTSWLRQLPGLMARRAVRGWKQKPAASRQARRGVAASSQFIARAESLEERALLSSITVTSLADNTTGDGQVTLREAIQAANTDSAVDGSTAGSGADTIVFAPGLTSGGAATITLGESHLTISSDLTITGPGADLLIIDGHDATGIFYFDNTVEENSNGELSGIVKLSGMTLTRGAGFTGVSAGLGGAVTNFADATLTDMIISNSTGPDGGGIFNQGDMALVNCLVTGNKETSSGGGGIYNDGDMTIDRTTVSENQTVGDGGGIQNTGTLTITNSTISNNSADGDDGEGGGISNYFEGEVTVKNSTVSGNTSGLSGGGLFNRGGVTIHNAQRQIIAPTLTPLLATIQAEVAFSTVIISMAMVMAGRAPQFPTQ